MRLIDADALQPIRASFDGKIIFIVTLNEIRNAQTIDVAPVVHGRWISIPHKSARVCSRCESDEPYKNAPDDADVYYYCPKCGAKMDGGA